MKKDILLSLLVTFFTIGLVFFTERRKDYSPNEVVTQTTVNKNDNHFGNLPKAIQIDSIHYFSIGNRDSFYTSIKKDFDSAIAKSLEDSLGRMDSFYTGILKDLYGYDTGVGHTPLNPSMHPTHLALVRRLTKKDSDALIKAYVTKILQEKPTGSSLKIGADSLVDSRVLNNGDTVTTTSKSIPVNSTDSKKYWTKIIFTSILGSAALWVVLSGRYDAETRKWAFSVLTGIFGVWIGSSI